MFAVSLTVLIIVLCFHGQYLHEDKLQDAESAPNENGKTVEALRLPI